MCNVGVFFFFFAGGADKQRNNGANITWVGIVRVAFCHVAFELFIFLFF